MAYIGKEPIVGNFQKCDAISVVNGQAAYTLQVSSTNVVPESANHMLVSLNGILQAPVTSFTVSGSTLTFASNLATGDVIDFVILLGNVLDLGTPSDGTVTNAKLASDLISGETDIGGAIADADLFLLDDGAGGTLRKTAASRIKTYVGGGISNAQEFLLTSDLAGSGSTGQDITANIAENATASYGAIGSNVSQSSGIFSFSATGIYLVTFEINVDAEAQDDFDCGIMITTDNNTYTLRAKKWFNPDSSTPDKVAGTISTIVDVTNTTNVKVKFQIGVTNSAGSDTYFQGGTGALETGFRFIRLGDT